MKNSYKIVKRFIDILLALTMVLLTFPVVLLVSAAIKMTLGSPIFFSQLRPGQFGKPFRMFKFRTMSQSVDESGQLLPDGLRINRFGALLRSTSLDELPSLWNVLKGDISVVGPRPLLMEYLPLYSAEQTRRHDVKPGVTGWAQVNGRNAISWDEKFKFDIWYVEHQTLLLDMKIILLTVKKVLFREDISADGEATMSKFTGES